MNYIPVHVRADFRLDGNIIPLTYIDPEGKTYSVQKVRWACRDTENPYMWIFDCLVRDGGSSIGARLLFSGERWYLCHLELE